MKILFSFFFSLICSSQVFAVVDFNVMNDGIDSKIPIQIKEGFLTTSTGTEISTIQTNLSNFCFRAMSGLPSELDHNNWRNMEKVSLPKKTKASDSVSVYTPDGKEVEGTLSNPNLNIIVTWNMEGNDKRQWAVLSYKHNKLPGNKKLTLKLHNINQTNHLLHSGGQEPCFYFSTTLFGDGKKITSGIHKQENQDRCLVFKEINEDRLEKTTLSQSIQDSSEESSSKEISSGENSSNKASSSGGSSHGAPPQSPKCKCEIL